VPLLFDTGTGHQPPPMESAIHSVEAAKETLLTHGFLDRKDSTVGDGIQEIEKKGFEFLSEYGLDFCQQYVLNTVSIMNHFMVSV
jgi:hypothetical protein